MVHRSYVHDTINNRIVVTNKKMDGTQAVCTWYNKQYHCRHRLQNGRTLNTNSKNDIIILNQNYRVRDIVLNATFNNIVAVSVVVGGNRSTRRKPPICRKSLTNFITLCYIEYTSQWAVFKLTTCGDSVFHTTMTTTAPIYILQSVIICKFLFQI
jgi:hypothetical protein